MLKIKINVGGTAIPVTLDDNATSRDFVSLLPLKVKLNDYALIEKVCDLPRRLSTSGAPVGTQAAVGDVTYYAPWGNLAIFYKNFGHATGLVKLGRVDSGLTTLLCDGAFEATISLIID